MPEMLQLTISGRKAWYRVPEQVSADSRLVLLLCGECDHDFTDAVEAASGCRNVIYAGLLQPDWDRDYPPWEFAMPNGRRFGNGAAATGEVLLSLAEILSGRIPFSGRPVILGYSLGGLASLYIASLNPAAFSGCGSCSGSTWYPGWIEWLNTHPISCPVWLSVGGREKNTRDELMSHVEEATRLTCDICRKTASSAFQIEPGGHFKDIPGRMGRAVKWLLNASEGETNK